MNLHVDGCWGPPPPTHPGADNKAANLQGTLEVQWVRKSHAERSFSGLLSYRHLSAGLIGPFECQALGRRPDYSITSSARPSSDSGKVRPNASPSNRGDPNKNCPRASTGPRSGLDNSIKLRAELFCYLLPLFCSCVPCSAVVPIRSASPNQGVRKNPSK